MAFQPVVGQGAVLPIRDVKDVLGAATDGGNSGIAQTDAHTAKGLADLGQQAGPVGGDEFQYRAALLRVAVEIDLGRDGEMPDLPGLQALHLKWLHGSVQQALAQTRANLDLPPLVFDRLPALLEHMVAIHHEIIVRSDDAGIKDGQAELIQYGGAMGEDEILVAGMDEDLRRAALA